MYNCTIMMNCCRLNSLSLSAEERHYAYDMYYLDCAIRNRCPILSYDERLISIAKKRGIKCL